MSASVAAALLRRLQSTFRMRVAEERYLDSQTGREVRTARHEDRYKAACGLAELMGMELEDG